MSKRDLGRFYPDLEITVAGRQATRYRTVYDIQDELEEAQAESNFSDARSVTPYDHSINGSVDGSLNNDRFAHDDLDSFSNVDIDVPPEKDLSHTKAKEITTIIEEMTGTNYTGLFVSGAPGLQAQTITFQSFIEELEKRCGVSIHHLILIAEKPLNKLVDEFKELTRDVAVRHETEAELEGVVNRMQTDTPTAVAERDETISELEGRIAEMEGIHRENEILKARIEGGMQENERLRARVRESDTKWAQTNAGLEGTVMALRNHNKSMEEKLNRHEGLPSGLCRTCHRIDPDEAGGHYH